MFVRIVYRVGLVVAYLLQTCAIVAAEVMASFYRPSSHTFERDTGLSASSPWGGFLSLGTSAHWLLWLCTRRGTRSRWFYRRVTWRGARWKSPRKATKEHGRPQKGPSHRAAVRGQGE